MGRVYANFDFVIVYRPGKESGKPDALSRRPDHEPQDTQEREHRIFTGKHFAMAINFVAEEDIQQRIQKCILRDEIIAETIRRLKKGLKAEEGFRLSGEILRYKGKIYVPQFNNIRKV